jgi:hypothetical protein
MNEGPALLSSTQLKERDWTPALVKKFLGSPDATKRNPSYRSAAPMQLYALACIEVCEQEDGWKQVEALAAVCSEVGKTVAARTAALLRTQAERMSITVVRLALDTLVNRAIASYNAFHEEMRWECGHDYGRASEQSDPAFLERIMVNAIRHHLTEYDTHREELAGQVGGREAGRGIRRRVSAQVAARYPEYAQECKRQRSARHEEAS